MFNFFKAFDSGSSLGVDIGTTSIKIAEIRKRGGKIELSNYGILETYGSLRRDNDVIQTSSLNITAKETAEMLTTLLKKGNFNLENPITSIPAFSSFITFLELPEMSPEDTVKALKYQMPQYIPMDIEETNVEWEKVGSREDNKGFTMEQIEVVSIPNEKIRRYQEIFKLAGLELKEVEVENLSLARVFSKEAQNPTLIIDVGSRSTNILVVEKGFLRMCGQTDFAGGSLTQAIAKGLEIDSDRAEAMKKEKGILTGVVEYELSTLTMPFLDVIINEAKRIKEQFEKSQDSKIEKVILTGGGANLLGFDGYAKQQFGLPVSIANPFTNISYPKEVELIIKELGPILSVAIGLAMKKFVK